MLDKVEAPKLALRCDDGVTLKPVSPRTLNFQSQRAVLRRRQKNFRDSFLVPTLWGLSVWQLERFTGTLLAWCGTGAIVLIYLLWSAGRERRALRRDLEISR